MPAHTPHLPSTARRGYRTFIEALDELVLHEPTRPYASVPRSDDLTQGYDEIQVGQVGRAVDAFAYWLLDQSSGRQDDFETIGYIGVNDLRYSMVFLGAMKCSKQAMFLSPKNTVAQNVKLIEATSCRRFLYSPECHDAVIGLKIALPELELLEVQPFHRWSSSYTRSFAFRKSYDDAKWDPVLTVHSSGSTGDPKPIVLPNGFFAANLERALPPVPGRSVPGHRIYDFEGGGKYLAPIPPFHLAGVMAQMYYPIFSQKSSTILGPPTRITTPADIKYLLDVHQSRILFIAPFYIEAVASMPGGLEALRRLDYVMFSGGPMARAVGDQLAPHVQIASFYGSGENGLAPFIMPRNEDWEWLELHPTYQAIMEAYDDETFELVVKKTGDFAVDEMRGTYWTRPNEQEHRTKDLFIQHPSKKGLWRFHGRKDDTLLLSNGEKVNPVPAENIILGCPSVGACLAVGAQRPFVGLLVEAHDGESQETLMDKVQPYITLANKHLSAGGQIQKMMVVPPGSHVRAPKGTTVRKLSEQKLAAIIDGIYETS